MEELTTEQAFNGLKELILKGVQFNGSLVEIDQKKQAVLKIIETVENALNLNEKENGE
jgi:hypothetical protein